MKRGDIKRNDIEHNDIKHNDIERNDTRTVSAKSRRSLCGRSRMSADGPPTTLSEHASKELLRGYDIPFAKEENVSDAASALESARKMGFPVVLKLCGDGIAHKTERDLVRLGLADETAVQHAATELLGKATPEDGPVTLLVAEMVRASRELILGLVRDEQFGPCVLVGIGGILAEIHADVAFAAAPVSPVQARRMIASLSAHDLIQQPFRGEPAADVDALVEMIVSLGKIGLEREDIESIDLNPVLIAGAAPVAVDALVELRKPALRVAAQSAPAVLSDDELRERYRPLFAPRGIVVAGVSGHPGKFGFATLHNLQRFGYQGKLFPVKPDGAEVLGRPTLPDVSEVPDGEADLVFVCTPNKVNVDLLRACAAKGVRAAFVTSAGYGEAGPEGIELQKELVATADELGILLIGPNGQGVISTSVSMCAQIVPPFPPAGRIAVASQSGNLVSSFLNYACGTGIGVSKAVSLGNSAQTSLCDLLDYFAADPETDVVLAYLEGVTDGEHFKRAVRNLTARKPLVLLKGGVAETGKRAAASHTGAMASDSRVFDGICHQFGVLLAHSVEQAFEWAATLATQPLPKGRRTIVFSTVGGWGVLAADACSEVGLDLIPLPDELRDAIDEMVPARWSRNNPIDLAGGEGRETIPEVLSMVARHPDVDAVIHLGIGIQGAQAAAYSSGPFYPDHGLERIASFHNRQDRRYAEAARVASEEGEVPVLSATELVHTHPENPGPAGVGEQGRMCHASAHRAVSALAALVAYAEFRSSAE
ncbi:MAG: acetate--CoA ligase family protein [Deltaproteobacteria bacterium]|nr:acetate--CoA ligase family protein [Deltaproteobacteria bacterium]